MHICHVSFNELFLDPCVSIVENVIDGKKKNKSRECPRRKSVKVQPAVSAATFPSFWNVHRRLYEKLCCSLTGRCETNDHISIFAGIYSFLSEKLRNNKEKKKKKIHPFAQSSSS